MSIEVCSILNNSFISNAEERVITEGWNTETFQAEGINVDDSRVGHLN